MNIDSLGARLKRIRKDLGKNQDEMALTCGVSREMWGKYERGLAMPGGDVLVKIATEGADVQYVLTGEERQTSPESLSVEEALMLQYFREAPPAVRKAAMGALLSVAPAQFGGMHGQSQSIVGDNAIQIGSVGNKARVRNR